VRTMNALIYFDFSKN